MSAISALRDALTLLDDELATITRRRSAVLHAITTFDLEDTLALVVEVAPASLPVAPAPPKARPAAGARPDKYDYPAIAKLVAAWAAAGEQPARLLADHQDVTIDMARYLIKRCKEKDLLDEGLRPVRQPFSEDVARDAAAGPTTGKVAPMSLRSAPAERKLARGPAPASAPARTVTADAVLALLER